MPRRSAQPASPLGRDSADAIGRRSGRGLLGAGFGLVAVNLRIAIASVSPVLRDIQRDLHLSSGTAGLLTTLPVLCFGLFAFVTPPLTRRYGSDRLIVSAMLILAAGILLRLLPSTGPLYAGTVVVGAAVAVGNVVMPGVVKRDFSHRIGLATGAYATALSLGATLSVGLTVPLESATGLGWPGALALWSAPAVAAAALWAPQLRRPRASVPTRPVRPESDPEPSPAPLAPTAGGEPSLRALSGDRLAWAVTLFMGLQSLGYYSTLTWVPTLFQSHHISRGQAGWLLSFSTFPAMAASLTAPLLARRLRRRWVPVGFAVILSAVAYIGLGTAPLAVPYLWMTVLGVGQGTAISLALGYIALRSPDVHHTGQLSTMAQGTGYLIAALGPVGVGALHAVSGGWAWPMMALVVLSVGELVAGVGASQDRHVQIRPHAGRG